MIKTDLQALRTSLGALGFATCVAVQTTTAANPNIITNIARGPRLSIESPVGWTNQIQYSTNLSHTNWTVLTNVLVTESPYSFIDAGAGSAPRRFYRFLAGLWVNQPPSFLKGADPTVNENSGLFSLTGWAT